MVLRLSLTDLGFADMLPRSLHYANRRSQPERRKKPGRFGRDDIFLRGVVGTVESVP